MGFAELEVRMHGLGMKHVVVTVVVIAIAAAITSLFFASKTVPPYPLSVSTENSTLGLRFSVALNSTRIRVGQAVNITAFATNLSSTPNNISWAHDFPPGLGGGWESIEECLSFANAEVYPGFYTLSNISRATHHQLQLAKPIGFHSCAAHAGEPWFSFFPFQPHEIHVGYAFSTSGNYSSHDPPATFHLFRPGVYTVAAGDMWGQLVIAHFIVVAV